MKRTSIAKLLRDIVPAMTTAACVACLLAGCPSNRELETGGFKAPAGADTGPGDAGAETDSGAAADAATDHRTHVFIPAAGRAAELEVRLVSGFVDQGVLTLKMATGGLRDVFGLYFRLAYDPAVLKFESLAPSNRFPQGSLVKAFERNGVLIAAISNKGNQPSVSFEPDDEIAVLKFRVVGGGPTELKFVQERSGAGDKYLQPAAGAWVGGMLEYR
ncbi:MAG: hypothetical protein HY897_01280 [Deltaproteobacteria bacterium]|nr:hypothetical protein [Deltaproteobacteria bacterium]